MIRINLLPRTHRKVRVGQRQLLIFLILIVVELAAMVFLYMNRAAEIDKRQLKKAGLTAEVQRLKKDLGDFDELKRQEKRMNAQREVVKKLQRARTGPVWLMRELSDILSAGKGPTINEMHRKKLIRDDPNADYNPNWDTRRLWLTSLKEKKGVVDIFGKAKDHDDVAELLKRLRLSEYFKEVMLKQDSQVMDGNLGLKLVQFSLRCRVTY
ncbi:MAG: PilN domain-containing protein [Pseudomonadota bacterium]